MKFCAWLMFLFTCCIFPIYYLWKYFSEYPMSHWLYLSPAIIKATILLIFFFVVFHNKKLIDADYLMMGCPYVLWYFFYSVLYATFSALYSSLVNLYLLEPMLVDILVITYFLVRVISRAKKLEPSRAEEVAFRTCKILFNLTILFILIPPLPD